MERGGRCEWEPEVGAGLQEVSIGIYYLVGVALTIVRFDLRRPISEVESPREDVK